MIYFPQTLQNKVLGVLHESLMSGGYFVIGIMENISSFNNDKKFFLVNEDENIFKKSVS